ncbi:hypothetical protein GCM10009665_71970 [Kitasatospora nipponensis]|uniref:HTH tetR-type domain-containing protein n=1 Tax=Kitasatospora nipponensis TaxID=258049 RepID=A0ABP4HSE9_9ACTN
MDQAAQAGEGTGADSGADSGTGAGAGTGPVDGRTERGRQTRERIADALLALLDEGGDQLAADAIARRAGVSRRLVFHHFTDLDQLLEVAITRRLDQLAALLEPLPLTADRAGRVRALVDERTRILEAVTPARVTVMQLERRSPRLREARDGVYRLARARLAELFAPELAPLPAARQREVLRALDAAAGWGSWYHGRTNGLEPAAAGEVMALTVTALLELAEREGGRGV